MKKVHLTYKPVLFLIVLLFSLGANAQTDSVANEKFDVKGFILDHLADTYEWTLLSTEEWHVSVPLPVILYSKTSGVHLFLSSELDRGNKTYKGFQIAADGKYKGKIVELDSDGKEIRPLDLSLTKNAASLILSSLVLIFTFLGVSRVVKRDPMKGN
ncbi:MAG: F0F1 ATP synthase subunit A, partial [Bacteroidales bacterium]|nr:F0F1 ATP synthase subunit A [Bacteroidales bacterium]